VPQGAASNTDQDPRKSYSFSGIQQTSRQGVPVPVVYGETIVGSVVISAGVDTVQVADDGSLIGVPSGKFGPVAAATVASGGLFKQG
jgi:hypothetical protein